MSLAERLRTALERPVDLDTILMPGDRPDIDTVGLSAAAVLVPITDRPEPGVILTQRTDTMRRHAGQIAFPGGRIDPDDADAVAAALREADEEIALSPSHVTVIGIADRYRTGTGFDITPVIGIITPDLLLVPHEAEVASVFEVPLAFLFDAANHAEASAMWQGQERHFYEIQWEDRRIWGATAGIIVNLARRLRWAP